MWSVGVECGCEVWVWSVGVECVCGVWVWKPYLPSSSGLDVKTKDVGGKPDKWWGR